MPTHNPPRSFVPRQGSPWLEDRRTSTFCAVLAALGASAVLLAALALHAPMAHQGVWVAVLLFGSLGAVAGGLGYGAAVIDRSRVQMCPACLSAMTRGATTCPHCHFHPSQEAP
jgi:hypothetical protein